MKIHPPHFVPQLPYKTLKILTIPDLLLFLRYTYLSSVILIKWQLPAKSWLSMGSSKNEVKLNGFIQYLCSVTFCSLMDSDEDFACMFTDLGTQ